MENKLNDILKFSEASFKRKLSMMTPELAEKVQYMGYKMIGESRIDLVFKTSIHSFQFTVRLMIPMAELEMMKVRYEALYRAFREMKYEHLNN